MAGARRRWQPEEDRLLGTAADRLVGEQLGRSRNEVAARRRKLGIAAALPMGRPRQGEDALAGADGTSLGPVEGVGVALRSVTAADARGYFRHCGYAL